MVCLTGAKHRSALAGHLSPVGPRQDITDNFQDELRNAVTKFEQLLEEKGAMEQVWRPQPQP